MLSANDGKLRTELQLKILRQIQRVLQKFILYGGWDIFKIKKSSLFISAQINIKEPNILKFPAKRKYVYIPFVSVTNEINALTYQINVFTNQINVSTN